MSDRPITRSGDRFDIELDTGERTMLRRLCEQQRDLLIAENPASDPAVARLFPPAYPDDLLRNLDYERGAGDRLLEGRLAALDTVAATIDSSHLKEEQVLAWLGVANDIRLVLGTRLDVSEESTEKDFEGTDAEAFGLYRFLTWLVDRFVAALATE